MPPMPNQFQNIADAFTSGKQFPNVVGYLDGTHIKVEILIVTHITTTRSFIHLLAVCYEDLSFTYIHAGWPGQ